MSHKPFIFVLIQYFKAKHLKLWCFKAVVKTLHYLSNDTKIQIPVHIQETTVVVLISLVPRRPF